MRLASSRSRVETRSRASRVAFEGKWLAVSVVLIDARGEEFTGRPSMISKSLEPDDVLEDTAPAVCKDSILCNVAHEKITDHTVTRQFQVTLLMTELIDIQCSDEICLWLLPIDVYRIDIELHDYWTLTMDSKGQFNWNHTWGDTRSLSPWSTSLIDVDVTRWNNTDLKFDERMSILSMPVDRTDQSSFWQANLNIFSRGNDRRFARENVVRWRCWNIRQLCFALFTLEEVVGENQFGVIPFVKDLFGWTLLLDWNNDESVMCESLHRRRISCENTREQSCRWQRPKVLCQFIEFRFMDRVWPTANENHSIKQMRLDENNEDDDASCRFILTRVTV